MSIVVVTVATALQFSGQQPANLVGVAYGQSATSLEELENQLAQANTLEDRLANYRAALIDYINNHNIKGSENVDDADTDSLEKIVDSYMDTCKSGSC
jgi:hypothetical protein